VTGFTAKMHQIRFGCGSAPDPTGGAHSAPLDPLAGFRGRGREGLRESVGLGKGGKWRK